jgi:hypothetical protein
MLDYSYRLELGPVAASVPAGALWPKRAPAAPAPGIRRLIDRLAGRRNAAGSAETGPDGAGGDRPGSDPALRAQAQAAYRAVTGAGDRALDAALGVMEAEILRLRDAVEAYGEALKSIEVYAGDDSARAAARAALRARPQRLQAAPPVPRHTAGRARPGHG